MSDSLRKFQQKDIELMEKLCRTLFHSGFWNRVRIDKAIAEAAAHTHGVLLDVGCGNKPYKKVFAPFVEKHLGIEYSPESVY